MTSLSRGKSRRYIAPSAPGRLKCGIWRARRMSISRQARLICDEAHSRRNVALDGVAGGIAAAAT